MLDHLIVGAGLYRYIYDRELTDSDSRVLVIDKKNHVAGNVYTKKIAYQRKDIIWKSQNLEEQAISLVGRDVYEKLIKDYKEKHSGLESLSTSGLNLVKMKREIIFQNYNQ